MSNIINILRAIPFIFALFINLAYGEETTSSFFIAEANNDDISSITQPLNSNTNEVSMLFDFGKKSESKQPRFSIILSDHEKKHIVSIQFIRNEEGVTSLAIKDVGQQLPLSNLGKSKRLSVVLSELTTNQLGIHVKGEKNIHQVIDLPFNAQQLKFWLKGGELNMYYMITR
ncbi:hypothetical protein [Thalassotalea castellviae]|uniref:AMIN domain-containing protein n=1 Tax=Thalassotalea castellviae TaxID=3075612 RepID=A0ABU3A2C7_9GAMM|nr:hypothetical protein [Thalassotalea sp. W431]MDT0604328.1 hypothetical protein [Thalassotalea sp. W431]